MERDNQFNETSTGRRNSDSAVSQGVFDELMACRNEDLKAQSAPSSRELQPTEIVFHSNDGKDHVLTQSRRAAEKTPAIGQKRIEDQTQEQADSGRPLRPVEIVFHGNDGKDHVLTQTRPTEPVESRPDRRDENTRPKNDSDKSKEGEAKNSSTEKSSEKTTEQAGTIDKSSEKTKSELAEKLKEGAEKLGRQHYEAAASKLIDAASMSPAVQKGEGYYQVLKRMYPSMNESDLVHLAADTKKLNGGRQLHTGEHFQVLDKEQKLRLRDQVMNDYDAKHKTDALDVYGDFAPEKGPMAAIHNAMRKDLSGRIEEKLDRPIPVEPPKPTPNPEPTKESPKAAMTAAEFGREAMMAFPKLDLDHNGFIDKQELGLAEQNKSLTDRERELAATMSALEPQLSKLSDEQSGAKKGVSLLDLAKFEVVERNVARLQDELNKLNNSFANPQLFEMIDQDGNRRLSMNELKNAMMQGNLTPADADSVNFLIENYRAAEKSVNDEFGPENSGVSYGDLHFMGRKASQSKDSQLINAVQSGLKIAHDKNLKQAPAKESTPA